MNQYISYGGGVNSTAMTILILNDPRRTFLEIRKRGPVRIIMSDTGSEMPETMAYISDVFAPWLYQRGHHIEWVRREKETLESYCLDAKAIPSRQRKWCTDKFKIKPIVAYLKAQGMLPTYQYLGFHYDEVMRRGKSSGREDIINEFPLALEGVNQQGCLDVITAVGLPLPMKSGCFFCPEAKKGAVVELERKHPDLFERACALEKNGSGYSRPKPFYLYSPKYPLPVWIVKGRIRKADTKPMGGCVAGCFTGDMREKGD